MLSLQRPRLRWRTARPTVGLLGERQEHQSPGQDQQRGTQSPGCGGKVDGETERWTPGAPGQSTIASSVRAESTQWKSCSCLPHSVGCLCVCDQVTGKWFLPGLRLCTHARHTLRGSQRVTLGLFVFALFFFISGCPFLAQKPHRH